MQSTIIAQGGSIWSNFTPEQQRVWWHLRFNELNLMPRNLRRDEQHEIVQLAWLIGGKHAAAPEPPIIDDDPHPDGIPENPIYSRGAR